jgi:ABC-type multidrug transport system ATPase subunit
MGSSSGPTCVKITAAATPAGDGQRGRRIGAGLVVSALGLTIGSGRELLRDASFAAPPGTLTAVIGPSGAGKSILAGLVGGMIRPSRGTVTFAGHDVHAEFSRLRRRIRLVPQDDVVDRQTLAEAVRIMRGLLGDA